MISLHVTDRTILRTIPQVNSSPLNNFCKRQGIPVAHDPQEVSTWHLFDFHLINYKRTARTSINFASRGTRSRMPSRLELPGMGYTVRLSYEHFKKTLARPRPTYSCRDRFAGGRNVLEGSGQL